jgi:hypothetical protein
MGLDILTPRGQQSSKDLAHAVSMWEGANIGWKVLLLPEDRASAIDGFLISPAGRVSAGVEAKCRYDITADGFRANFQNEWLVTMNKIVTARTVCDLLCMPLVGFLYLVESRVLMVKKLVDEDGDFCAPFRCDQTPTKKTINGGEAVRANAYIKMDECIVVGEA